MKHNLISSHIFMGVSLSNRTFDRIFAKRFGKWIEASKVQRALIVIFDLCEVVNMKVFQGLGQKDAEQHSVFRAVEMKRMFDKIFLDENIEVTMQSEYVKKLYDVSKLAESIRNAYQLGQTVYADIQKQIKENLIAKSARVGDKFISDNIDALSEYIILELAWFYDFFAKDDKATIEVYPGAELFTKRNLIQGKYQAETGIPALSREPIYIDIRNLISSAIP